MEVGSPFRIFVYTLNETTMKTERISQIDLIELLAHTSGSKFCSMTTVTEPTLKKTGNPFLGSVVEKTTEISLLLNFGYDKAVKNRLVKKGIDPNNFQGSGLPWGRWMVGNKIIEHKESIYARTFSFRNSHPTSSYSINGVEANEEQVELIKSFLPASVPTGSAKQYDAGLDKLEQVKPMTLKIESIRKIKIGGVEYIID